jgi:soluble lytic murein transglycosylase-like protein
MRKPMHLLLCAAAIAALAAPALAQEKSRARAETQFLTPFSFFRALFAQPAAPAQVDRTNKESRLNAAPRGAVWPQTRFGTRIVPAQPAAPETRAPSGWDSSLDAAIARHASANGVPLELARRVVKRESGGNPRAVSKGNYGLMQIRLGTARAMGYRGNAQGLLDAETNMTYAMRYLAGAHRAAGGNHDRAVALYARGYYPEAKRMGFSPYDPPRTAALGAFGRFAGN